MLIHADARRIFALAADTQSWPEILPHYRYVRRIAGDAQSQTVEMSAWRDFIPVRWTARQWNDPRQPGIKFHHIAGWTRGMDVRWQFENRRDGTLVRIVHELDFRFPVAADLIAKHIIGRFFVHNIAGKTLRRIKELAERG